MYVMFLLSVGLRVFALLVAAMQTEAQPLVTKFELVEDDDPPYVQKTDHFFIFCYYVDCGI